MKKHILVPVDLSSSSESAFEHVLEETPEARITLLHVMNPGTVFNYATAEGFDFEKAEQKEQERRDAAEQIFNKYREKTAARDREIKTEITAGDPAEQILEYSEERGIDHIVMGNRGRSGIQKLVLGSVAEAVVIGSPIPVTIIPYVQDNAVGSDRS